MLVQATSNSQEYRLILSAIRKYIYNVDVYVYTTAAMIYQLSIPHISCINLDMNCLN